MEAVDVSLSLPPLLISFSPKTRVLRPSFLPFFYPLTQAYFQTGFLLFFPFIEGGWFPFPIFIPSDILRENVAVRPVVRIIRPWVFFFFFPFHPSFFFQKYTYDSSRCFSLFFSLFFLRGIGRDQQRLQSAQSGTCLSPLFPFSFFPFFYPSFELHQLRGRFMVSPPSSFPSFKGGGQSGCGRQSTFGTPLFFFSLPFHPPLALGYEGL